MIHPAFILIINVLLTFGLWTTLASIRKENISKSFINPDIGIMNIGEWHCVYFTHNMQSFITFKTTDWDEAIDSKKNLERFFESYKQELIEKI